MLGTIGLGWSNGHSHGFQVLRNKMMLYEHMLFNYKISKTYQKVNLVQPTIRGNDTNRLLLQNFSLLSYRFIYLQIFNTCFLLFLSIDVNGDIMIRMSYRLFDQR